MAVGILHAALTLDADLSFFFIAFDVCAGGLAALISTGWTIRAATAARAVDTIIREVALGTRHALSARAGRTARVSAQGRVGARASGRAGVTEWV